MSARMIEDMKDEIAKSSTGGNMESKSTPSIPQFETVTAYGVTAPSGFTVNARITGTNAELVTDVKNLISAAPELLEACKELLLFVGENADYETKRFARAAIAKAEGK